MRLMVPLAALEAPGSEWGRPGTEGGPVGRGLAGLNVAANPVAALLTLGGVLWVVLATKPIRPYGDGAWRTEDLFLLGALGLLAALPSKGAAGVAGIVLGLSGAIGLQLFVITGQAPHTDDVRSVLSESAWLPTVGTALGLGLAVMLGVYGLVRVGLWALKPGQRARVARPSRRSLPSIGVMLVALALSGLWLVDAAGSAYVSPLVRRVPPATGSSSLQLAGELWGLIIAGWATAGSIMVARGVPRGVPRLSGGAMLAGIGVALVVAMLVAFAVQQSYSPF